MPIAVVQILLVAMSEVAEMMLGMLVFGLILRGGSWLMNWRARHPRPIKAENEYRPGSGALTDTGIKADLPAVFRMAIWTQILLYIVLLSPPVAATLLILDEWEGGYVYLLEILVGLLNPSSLFLICIVYLLCPYTVWNIYWRRRDFIRFDSDEINYRSGFQSGKLVPAKLTMFRGRSWRFDLVDLFRGQMASSWFLEIVPAKGTGKNTDAEQEEHVILDLKAMNLGGSARAIAKLASRVYEGKFLINNQLP